MWMGVTATRWRVVDESLLSVKADYLKRSVLEHRHCFIVRQKCYIFHPPWPPPSLLWQKSHFLGFFAPPPPLSRDGLLQWSLIAKHAKKPRLTKQWHTRKRRTSSTSASSTSEKEPHAAMKLLLCDRIKRASPKKGGELCVCLLCVFL